MSSVLRYCAVARVSICPTIMSSPIPTRVIFSNCSFVTASICRCCVCCFNNSWPAWNFFSYAEFRLSRESPTILPAIAPLVAPISAPQSGLSLWSPMAASPAEPQNTPLIVEASCLFLLAQPLARQSMTINSVWMAPVLIHSSKYRESNIHRVKFVRQARFRYNALTSLKNYMRRAKQENWWVKSNKWCYST